MKDFFKSLTGYYPRPLQERTAVKLLDNRNIILTAPTGAGKTYAALVPFLWSKHKNKSIADRLIYALPLRTLATSLYEDTKKTCKNLNLNITIQTGEQKKDPFFEGDMVFTTIDQLLSGYLNIPVSLPARVSNINAGALIGAMVVFDEFHLLDPGKAMETAIEMMDRLKQYSRFVIMTATMPEESCNWLAKKINAERVVVGKKEVSNIQGKFDKGRQVRNWEWKGCLMSAKDILKIHQQRSIIICNTVKRAQGIYRELERLIKQTEDKTGVVLLHSRFFPDDRRSKEKKVLPQFDKKAQSENADIILVTTQVVEAGIDISAENLHTEIAPMNSLVQRAGRCARYGGEGKVWVYELEDPQKTMPYLPELVESTRLEFENKPITTLNFLEEQELVNKVHTKMEGNAFSLYDNLNAVRGKIRDALEYGERHKLSELIREIDTINVLVTDNPDGVRFDKAKWPFTLSIPRTSLWQLKDCFKTKGNNDSSWILKRPESTDDEGLGLHFEWRVINDIKEAIYTPWLIAVHPNYACYSKETGLEIGVAGDPQKIEYRDCPQTTAYHYYCETWLDHVQRLMPQCDKLLSASIVSLENMSKAYNFSENQLRDIARLACILHDAGKLSTCWQKATENWQADNYPNNQQYLKNEPLAHTTYNPEKDWQKFRSGGAKYNRGHHALEGAFAIANCIFCYYNTIFSNKDFSWLTRLTISAIARHHGGRASELSDFRLVPEADVWIKRVLSEINLNLETKHLTDRPDIGKREAFKRGLINFTNPDWEKWIPLYFWLVRLVRLADQKGTAMHTGGNE